MNGSNWISDLIEDLRFGVRTLRRNPGFTVVAVLTLALGIGANTAIFSVIENVLLRPLPYDHPESLVEIKDTYPGFQNVGISPGDFFDWRRDAKSFSSMGAYGDVSQGFNLTGIGEPERVVTTIASAGLFTTLGIRAQVGRTFFPEEDKKGGGAVALLSHAYWQRRFGADPSIVGREVALDGQKVRIVGVLPTEFQVMRSIEIWLPMPYYGPLEDHIHHGISPIARLRPGVTVGQAAADVELLNRQSTVAYPDSHKSWGTLVRPMEDPDAAQLRTTLLVLFGAVALVLLIACANIANLLLARNAARNREMALRTALGAEPWRLVRQLLTESTLLALCGGVAGLILAIAGIRALASLAPPELTVLQHASLNGRVLLFTLGMCVVAGIFCGLLPALRSRLRDLNSVLKQGSKGSGAPGSHRMHNALVVCEIALALVPLVGAGLLLRSFQHLLDVAPGFQADHMLSLQVTQAGIAPEVAAKITPEQGIELSIQQSRQFDQIVEQVNGLPGVKASAGISTLPLGTELREASRFVIEGEPLPANGARPVSQVRTVTPGYFETMEIPLLRGRLLTRDDWKTQDKVVINEALAQRFFANRDPLGHRLNYCSLDPKPCWTTIVGVVGNVHQFGLDAAPTWDSYFVGGWTRYLLVRTAQDPSAAAGAVTQVVHRIDPSLPVTEVTTLDGLLSRSVSPRRFSAVLIAVLAGLALVLSAVGIYGVMSYTVGQRTQEIGIRMALGAKPGNMLALVLGRGARLALAGIVVGLFGAFALTRFLSSLLFGVGTTDPLTFAGVAALLLGVAMVACYVPARRAMRVDPMVALRYE
jgi:putative ABC transport system permease protein